jgi:hypothetical protein
MIGKADFDQAGAFGCIDKLRRRSLRVPAKRRVYMIIS